MSRHFGHLQCPDCTLEICIHDEGWHVDHSEPENQNFDEMKKFVVEHTESHDDR